VSTTATNYLSKIYNLKDFPTPGVDNDSQGFRDQWANIHGAIDAVNDEISYINTYAFKGDGPFDFYGNTLKNVGLQNASNVMYEYDLQAGDIVVDYALGGYQAMTVAAGTHNLNVINWPNASSGNSGYLTLAIATTDLLDTSITFTDDKFQSFDTTSTYTLLPGTNLFEMWSEEGVAKRSAKYYVKKLGYSASTSTIYWTEVKSKDGTVSNRYTVGPLFDTVVSHGNQTDSSNYSGAVALVPNIVSTTISIATAPGDQWLAVTSSAGIYKGAAICLSNTTTIYTVIDVGTQTNTVKSSNVISPLPQTYDVVRFINPRFPQQLSSLYLSTSSAMPTTATSIAGEMRGQVYVDNSSTYFVYADSTSTVGSVNKIKISGDRSGNPLWLGAATTATTADISNTSTVVATTEWVWNYVNSSTTVISYADTSSYSTFATSSTYANTASTMISGTNGYGKRTVSYEAPTGGTDGDIWYQII
jgi:hypothetical protein